MKNQFHVVCDPELYSHCSVMANELGLADSAFIRMLIGKAWKERGGDIPVKVSSLPAAPVVELPRAEEMPVEYIHQGDRDFEETVAAEAVRSAPAYKPLAPRPKGRHGNHSGGKGG